MRNAEVDGELDVLGPEEVDEGVDAVGRRGREAVGEPVAIGDRDDAVRREPSWLASDAMPRTLAPLVRRSWTTTEPTPPAAAETATVSPGRTSTARTAT